MRKMLMQLLVFVLMASGLSIAFVPAAHAAQEQVIELPSSNASGMSPWLVMNPTTFQLTHAAVLEQYDRVAAVESALTPEKRDQLEAMLAAGAGEEVWVPDRIGLDYLTGRKTGQPYVYERMRKEIGRVDRALLFDLGDGVYVYWFTGTQESCNNIGVVVLPPEPLTGFSEYVAPPPPIEYVWVMMPQHDLEVFRAQGYIPSVYVQACCNNPGGFCSSLFISGQLFMGGQVDEDPTLIRVRVPRQS